MKLYTARFRIVKRRERAACAVAAATCTVGIVGALLLCFNAASPDTWLVATPELMTDVARCDAQKSRAEQTQCKQSMVAMRLAPDPQLVQLAKR